jgi:biotin operon repressor
MAAGSQASFVVFLQKETFNRADHFLYGKMDLIDLTPLDHYELLKAYKQKWGGYEPFTEDALLYVARMSCGIFRRFKKYIGLALYVFARDGVQPSGLLDSDHVRDAISEEEIMRDLGKDLEAIFRNPQQTERATRLLKLISDQEQGISQKAAAEKLELNEMAVSRLARELEEHGYIIRTTRTTPTLVYDKELGEHVESSYVEKIMHINPYCSIAKEGANDPRVAS